MTIIAKLTAIVDAMNEILTLIPTVEAALTAHSLFLDTV